MPDKEGFLFAIGRITGEGHTLTSVDVREIQPHYGYQDSKIVLESGHGSEAVRQRRIMRQLAGTVVDTVIYRKSIIFYEYGRNLEDTDIDAIKERIDRQMAAAAEKRKNTIAAKTQHSEA